MKTLPPYRQSGRNYVQVRKTTHLNPPLTNYHQQKPWNNQRRTRGAGQPLPFTLPEGRETTRTRYAPVFVTVNDAAKLRLLTDPSAEGRRLRCFGSSVEPKYFPLGLKGRAEPV